MPVTSGIKCAFCKYSFQSDHQMSFHLKVHKDEIKAAREFNRKEADRIRKQAD